MVMSRTSRIAVSTTAMTSATDAFGWMCRGSGGSGSSARIRGSSGSTGGGTACRGSRGFWVPRVCARSFVVLTGGPILSGVDHDPGAGTDPEQLAGRRIVKADAHRKALRHLHPVSARVLRRQNRERGARAGADALARPVEGDAGGHVHLP